MAGKGFEDIKKSIGDQSYRQQTAVLNQHADQSVAEVSAGETKSVTHDTKFPLMGYTTLALYSYVVDDAEASDVTFASVAVKYKLYRRRTVGAKDVFALLGSEGTVTLTAATYVASGGVLVPGTIAISDSNIEAATHISFEADFTALAGSSVGVELGKTAAL